MFKVGDIVKWKSQAQGSLKEKIGKIVEEVNPYERPSQKKFPDLYKNSGCGYGRPERSYVVRVNNKHYWPRTKHLIKFSMWDDQD